MDSKQYIEASWRRINRSYRSTVNIAGQVVGVTIKEEGDVERPAVRVTVVSSQGFQDLEAVRRMIIEAFRLDDDIEAVYMEVGHDPCLKKLTREYRELRLVRYINPEECLLVYHLSTNTTIKRLEGMVECLKTKYGNGLRFQDGVILYTYPKIQQFAGRGLKDLKDCKLGYKGPYLLRLAELYEQNPIEWGTLRCMDLTEARGTLMRLPGVGDKVADAVLLYATGRTETFPIDIWVRRAVVHLYHISPKLTYKQLKDFLGSRFGSLVGYVEPYLYHYARTHKLIKKTRLSKS